MKDYNVIVIGAGSGGLVSAYISAVLKAKVLLIEKHKMGGDCLNTGCVPSKALIRTASVLAQIRRFREFGLAHAHADFDFAAVMERVQRIIKKVEPHDSVARYTLLGVECLQGEAQVISPHEVQVNGKVYTTKNIIVATGGSPAIPQIPGLNQVEYLHTDNIWNLRQQPKRLVIVGGGPIGCELGQCFARLGTKITLLQKASQLLNKEDDEIIKIMQERFIHEGMDIRLNTNVLEIKVRGSEKSVVVASLGKKEEIPFDQILLAVGRKANSKGFGLEETGVQLNPNGTIATDDYSRTNIKNIFACGDVTSPYQFTHMAAHQAWYCAVNALFGPFKKFKIDFSVIPWCTYTDPEVARLGLNEKEARAKGIAYEVLSYPIEDLDRAIADEEGHGVVKVLTKPGRDEILGVTICGFHAGDILQEFVFAKKNGLGLNAIMNTIHPYPTMVEANKYAAGAWKKAHAPEALLGWIGKFHALRR